MHTPGPWYFQKSLEGPEYIIKPIPGDVVAVTDPQETEIEEMHNATLIAAAPDMLFELKTIRRIFNDEGRKYLVEKLDKVISKAEGRDQNS